MLFPLKSQQWPTPSSLKQSLQLITQILITNSLSSPSSVTHLLISLCKPETGSLSIALSLFSEIPNPSTFHYNTVIRTCSQYNNPFKSIHLFHQMHRKSIPFDSYSLKFLFKSCGQASLVVEGKLAHGLLVKLFLEANARMANPLIQMYVELGLVGEARSVFDGIGVKDVVSWTTMLVGFVKGGILDEARKLFDEMPERNVVSWTSFIGGYLKAGHVGEAVELFKGMMADGVAPDAATMVLAFSACVQLRDLEFGRWLHRVVEEERISMNGNLACAIIDIYAKCGDIEAAHKSFDLMGYKVLPAWNALIDGYCKIGNLDAARSLFDQMETHDLITFNSMITGYIHVSRLNEALLLFAKLRASGLHPDKFTIVGLLTLCAGSGLISQGRALHAYIESSYIKPDIFLGTALVDMYSKCGKMDQATLVFNRMRQRDVRTWTAIITGFAMNGMGKLALEHFSSMLREGIKPNAVAYVGILNACSHSGLLKEGQQYFKEMQELHNIEPKIEHYGCMVDLYGRHGHLKEAEKLITSMPMKPNAVIWGSLLHACRVHKNIHLAERVAEQVIELEPNLDAGYVQLYNIYMDFGRARDASMVRRLMEERGIRKIAGFSSITIGNKIHRFIAGDQTHPENAEIEKTMREIAQRLKAEGYVPVTSKISVEMDEEEKEEALFGHSERMAIAFGILKLDGKMTIHVVKNLRVCDDCHGVIKLISKFWCRNIVVRDRSRFHHFSDGKCSCNDFW